jgi:ferric-dicitrate binding protein FerR (iron transport regulator)
MLTITNLTDLLMKHLQGSLSNAEQEQLNQWRSQSERNRRLFASINDEEQLRQLVLAYHQEEEEDNETIILSKIRQQIGSNTPTHPVRRISRLQRFARVAAVVLLLAGVGGYGYFLINRKKGSAPTAVAPKTVDIPPGRDGAILTLSDGRQVVLDSLGNGVVATQNGTQVIVKNGALAYTPGAGSTAPVYNTLTTPKGRQFQLILPDGTKVWLNAASSLRYPTVFPDSGRTVEVTGEVYFEVASIQLPAKGGRVFSGQKMPFTVNINDQAQIQVLGTQFNVNAYANEAAIKTTLVEGSLKIVKRESAFPKASADKWAILKPGEQAVARANSPLTIDHSPDVAKAIAWKSGFFNFEDANLEEVMRQLERWYDIEVVYEKNIPDIQFGGKMSNNVSLSGLLKSLQEMGVHFRIEGRKLIVLP